MLRRIGEYHLMALLTSTCDSYLTSMSLLYDIYQTVGLH